MLWIVRLLCFLVITLLCPAVHFAAELPAEQLEFFESKIRPILVDNCYQCHSVDAEELEGGLLLDSKWGWETGGDSGPAVKPGDLDQSLLIEAVRYSDDVVSAMPPKSKLSDKQIKLLEQWVEMGAPDPREKAVPTAAGLVEAFDLKKRFEEHWSWRPVTQGTPPRVDDQSWPINEIDRYVLERIEAAGLLPASPADNQTILRRLYFDLIGLPPSPEQVEQFLKASESSENAYEQLVDQLLDSPFFGEKWARHWMDLVRYAETYGHEFDYPIDHAQQYRDYLIRAFNADLSYDQLIREHIAGDLMSPPRRNPQEQFNESIIGTGFWYFHEATHAPTDSLGNEADIIDNQLDVFGKAFLGLTVACARCHDHKFDAISTADYYALSAYIQSSCRQLYPLDPGRKAEIALSQLQRLRQHAADLIRQSDLIKDPKLNPGPYFAGAGDLIRRVSGKPDQERLPHPDPSWVAEMSKEHGLELPRLQKWIAMLTSADLNSKTPGPSEYLAIQINDASKAAAIGNRFDAEENRFATFREKAELFADFDSGLPPGWTTSGLAFQPVSNALTVPIGNASAKPGTVDSGFFGTPATGILRSPTFEIRSRNIHVRMRGTTNVLMRVVMDNYQMAVFNGLLFNGTFFKDAATDTQGHWAWKSFGGDLNKYIGHNAYLEFVDSGNGSIAIDEIWFSDEGAPQRTSSDLTRRLAAEKSSLDQLWTDAIVQHDAGKQSEFLDWLRSEQLISVDDLAPTAGPVVQQVNQLAAQIPPPRYVVAMAQGSPENAHIYIRGGHNNLGDEVPARFLEALGGAEGSRLELAGRIASPDNPLTARVFVNRIWHHLLGRGIVPSVDDFGPQGQPPSHPELLDWLASDFVAGGWSIKHTIRAIVMSQTYRQSSVANPNVDPAKIATVDPTNSLLHRARVRRLPAESIRDAILAVSGRLDPTPISGSVATFRTPFMTGRGARGSGPLDGDGKRSIYLSIYRNFLNPFLLTFDMPSPFGPKGRRSSSNVPAQALTLMNDPFVIQQAGVWADKLMATRRSEDERIASMVLAAHGTRPTSDQLGLYRSFLDSQAMRYGAMDKRAWADLAHSLLNMKAFYYLR